MADESIVIQIDDGVDSSISTKIDGISKSAKTAYTAVQQLQSMIAQLSGSSVAQLASQLQQVTSATQSLANAQQSATNANNQSAQAAAALQRAQAQAATATQQLANAQTQGQIAAQNLASAQIRTNTAMSQSQTAATNSATATQRLSTAQNQTATSAQNLANAQQRNQTLTAQTEAAQSRAALAALKLQQAQDAATRSSGTLSSELSELATKAAAFYASIAGVEKLASLADSYTALQNKLQMVASSQADVNTLTDQLFAIADKTRTSVDATATAFTRFDRSLQAAGKSQQDALRMTQTINEALVNSGATAQEASSALLQLSQAFNSGRLQGDEFRSVSENMPIVLTAVANVLGKTTAEVKQLSTQGAITAQVLYQAFQSIQASTDATFAKTVPTLSQAFTVLENNFMQFIGNINSSTGITSTLAQLIISLANNMDLLATAAASLGVALVAVFGPQLLAMIGSAITAVAEFTVALATNPLGLLAVAITAVLGLLYSFRNELVDVGVQGATLGDVLIAVWNDIAAVFAPVIATIKTAWHDAMSAMGIDSQGFFTDLANLLMKITPYFAAVTAAAIQFGVNLKAAFTGEDTGRTIVDAYNDELKTSQASMKAFVEGAAQVRQAATAAGTAALNSTNGGQWGAAQNKAAESRALALQKVNAELDKQLSTMFELNPQRAIDQQFDQITIQLASKKITLNQQERQTILDKITAIQQQKDVQTQLDAIYNQVAGPLKTYNDGLQAANILLQNGTLNGAQFEAQVARLTQQYQQATDPLAAYNKNLQEQLEVLQQVGPAQETERQIIQARNAALQAGLPFGQQQVAIIQQTQAALQNETNVANARNSIYDQTTGKVTQLNAQLQAYNQMLANGTISGQTYQQGLVQIQTAAANLRLEMGNGTWTDAINAGLGSFVSNYQGVMAGLSQAWGSFFTNFENGFADSIGQAIAQGKSLSDTLGQVAQQVEGELIASLIKVGLQYVVNAALAQTATATTTATSTAAAATTTAAWAPAAAVASAGSFGGAAIAGMVAIGVLFAAVMALASKGFSSGGYTGNTGTGNVAGVVHGQEFVMNAAATKRIGVSNLQALQDGKAVAAVNANGGNGQSAGNIQQFNFNFEQSIQVQGSSTDSSADSLEKSGAALSQKVQSDIMDSIRSGGTWAKIIKQAAN